MNDLVVKAVSTTRSVLLGLFIINTLNFVAAAGIPSEASTAMASGSKTGLFSNTNCSPPFLIEAVIAGLPGPVYLDEILRKTKPNDFPDLSQPREVTSFNPTIGSSNITAHSSGFRKMVLLNRDLDSLIQTLAGDNRTRIIQKPRIMTASGVPATIFVGSTIPYCTCISRPARRTEPNRGQRFHYGTELTLTPLVRSNELIDIQVLQRATTASSIETIPGVGDDVKSTGLQAGVTVRDGDTFAISGLIFTGKRQQSWGIPYLKEIPFLGALFHGTYNTKVPQELVIFFRLKTQSLSWPPP